MRPSRAFPAVLALLASLLLAGCGGGGGNGSVEVRGTAAAGAPIAAAVVTLRDANGVEVTDTTAPDGTYSVTAPALTPPFLVECDDGAGTVLFSIGSGPGVVNVTPFTDLVISSYYEVHDVTLDGTFFRTYGGPGLQGAVLAPTSGEVDAIASVVGGMVSLWLQQEGVDPTTFDLIETPFDADGSGFDAVLDLTTVDGNDVTVTDGTTTTTSTITADLSGMITVETTTTSGGSTTTSLSSTTISTSAAGQTDLEGATAALDDFFDMVRTRGSSIVSAHVLPFLDNGFLDGGTDRTFFAAEVATSLRDVTVGDVNILRVVSIDDVNHIVDLEFSIEESAGGQSQTEAVRMAFKRVGSAYLLFGNQRVADIEVQMEARTFQGASGTTEETQVAVQLSAPVGTVNDSVTVDGGPFSGAAVPKDPNPRSETLHPTPTTDLEFVEDTFFVNSGNVTLPASGTLFQVHLTPTGGSQVTYEADGGNATNEFISITSPTGHAFADANVGGTLTVQWTLPTTFAVTEIDLDGIVFDGQGNSFDFDSVEPILGPTATSGRLQFPATWNDSGGTHTVTGASIDLTVEGLNGERTVVSYTFE